MNKKVTYNAAALVTGGSKRIGQAIALKLSSLGYAVALHYNTSATDAKKTQQLIKKSGGSCTLFKANLSNETDVKKLIKQTVKSFPNLSILVNNASVFKRSSLQKLDLKTLKTDLDVHLKTPYILCSEFKRLCKKGLIINMLDTKIQQKRTDHFSYLLSKKGLADLTEMAAAALAPAVRVNGIAPGLILPPEQKSSAYLKRLANTIPLKRKGSVENITASIEFLINNDYVTGQIIYTDGGEHLIT